MYFSLLKNLDITRARNEVEPQSREGATEASFHPISPTRTHKEVSLIMRYLLCSLMLAASLPLAAGAVTQLENFEFADSNANAAAGVTDVSSTGQTATATAGSGEDKSEQAYSLGITPVFDSTAFGFAGVQRDMSSPLDLSATITAGNVANIDVRIDILGDPALAAGASGTNLWVRLLDADDDDVVEFYNISEGAATVAGFSTGLQVGGGANSRIVQDGATFDGQVSTIRAAQILLEDADGDSSTGTVFVDNLTIRFPGELFAGIVEDFEFADTDGNASTGVFVGNNNASDPTIRSGSGANANQALYSLAADYSYTGNPFSFSFLDRTFDNPVELSQPYGNLANGSTPPTAADATGLALTLDVLGDANFGSGANNANLFIQLFDADDDDDFRFIAFVSPQLASGTWTNNLTIPFFDDNPFNTSLNRDYQIQRIRAARILIEEPDGDTYTATAHFDDMKIAEPGAAPFPTLNYTIALIDPVDAPDVTDSTFDVIYSNSGAHQAITGGNWKDWAQRLTDPFAPISDNLPDGPNIAATSAAYVISDGVNLYFGMIVYDPNTSLMTADTGDDTFTKWNVEDIEVAFSNLPGAAGVADSYKFAMDAFGHIDDMYPDGTTAWNSGALVNSNSYIIDANTWACEFAVDLSILASGVGGSGPSLAMGTDTWYGHIGYQSPGVRVPLYAAANGDGFSSLSIEYDLSALFPTTAVESWLLYR